MEQEIRNVEVNKENVKEVAEEVTKYLIGATVRFDKGELFRVGATASGFTLATLACVHVGKKIFRKFTNKKESKENIEHKKPDTKDDETLRYDYPEEESEE